MSHLFLLNEAIEVDDFSDFKNGMLELNCIEKNNDDEFLKHESIYELSLYGDLYSSFGQEEQVISKFIEQCKPCNTYLANEEQINTFFNNEINGFLGIDFNKLTISDKKQISDEESYIKWCYEFLPNINKLKFILGSHSISSIFIKQFKDLSIEDQEAIIESFFKAKNRKTISTPFAPDGDLIKDVSSPKASNSQSDLSSVYELRIFRPNALRIYFWEAKDELYISGIGKKNSGDQSEDIVTAGKNLKSMVSK